MKIIRKTPMKVFIMLVTCLLLVSFSSSNEKSFEAVKIIKIAGDESFPPYEFLEENGSYRGFNVDIMNAIAVETGVHIEIIPMEWQEALNALGNGRVDAIQGMTKSQSREEFYMFSQEIVTNSQVIFVLKDTVTISSEKDLGGHTVALQKGDISWEKLKNIPNINIVFTENQNQAMNFLLQGKADAFVGNRLVGLYNLQKANKSNNVKIVGEPLNVSQYCSAVLIGNSDILEVLNSGIEKIKSNGTYEKIYFKWFGESFNNNSKEYRKFIFIGLFIVMLLLVLIIAYALINRSLKRAIDERTSEIAATNEKLEGMNELLVNEINERKKVEDMAWHQAHFDYLTDLPNRRLFIKKLNNAIEKSKLNDEKIAVLFVDLDDFKHVNDSLGHQCGDDLLIKFAERLLEVCNPYTIVSRFGGDEFTIMLENINNPSEAYKLVERLTESLNRPFIIDNNIVTQYASIGVSIYPESGEDADALLNSADNMMYEIKAKNKRSRK